MVAKPSAQSELDRLKAEFRDPATPGARKPELHRRAHEIYYDLAAGSVPAGYRPSPEEYSTVLRLLFGDEEIAQSHAELVQALTRARLVHRHMTRDGERDDWIQDEAERMAVAGETGPVMIPGDPPDMVAIEAEARAAYDAQIERYRQFERMTKKAATTPRPSAARSERPREQRAGRGRTQARAPDDPEPDLPHPTVTVPVGWTSFQTVWYVARLLLDEPRLFWHLAALSERRGDYLAFETDRRHA